MRVVSFSEARNRPKNVIDQVIDDTHRLVCCVDDMTLVLIACRYHCQQHPHQM